MWSSDESRERILTLSHSPSVIKPSQAMGVCQGSRAFRLPMSPRCSRAASDSSGVVRRKLLLNSESVMLDVLCPDEFVICSLRIYSKKHQNAIRILLPLFNSEMHISDWESFKTVVIAVLSWNDCKALFYENCSCRSVLVRKGQFSLKWICILENVSEQSKTYAKTVQFAKRILLPLFFTCGEWKSARYSPHE
jgi:hypothetical protein